MGRLQTGDVVTHKGDGKAYVVVRRSGSSGVRIRPHGWRGGEIAVEERQVTRRAAAQAAPVAEGPAPPEGEPVPATSEGEVPAEGEGEAEEVPADAGG